MSSSSSNITQNESVQSAVSTIVNQVMKMESTFTPANWMNTLIHVMERIDASYPALESSSKKTLAIAVIKALLDSTSVLTPEMKDELEQMGSVLLGPVIDALVRASKGLTRINYRSLWTRICCCIKGRSK